MSESEICDMTAVALAARIKGRSLSVAEVMQAHLARIARVNPALNAIVTLLPEQAMQAARAADAAMARGDANGLLFGLPVAHKDLAETRGIRTTFGSPIHRDYVPDFDAPIVERLRAAGAITIGKTNTPEFGAGSQTFNTLFGATRNPYDPSKTCGGSSGGAAVALAAGMVPIADGSDMGGSLRNPAGYCNVVGFRTSPGLVPSWPDSTPWLPLGVDGPMARSVADVALMLQAIVGPDPRAPLSFGADGGLFAQSLETETRGLRVAWSADLGGLPLDPRTRAVFESQRRTFADLGCLVEEATPDLSDADEVFQVLRAFRFEIGFGELLDTRRDQLKDTIVWNTEQGRALSGPQVGRAMQRHAMLFQRFREFLQQYDFLITPVSQVPPFPIDQPYVTEIDGVPMGNYIEWMRSCYYITVTAHPSIAVPAGFTPEGLPVGLQIVGRYRDELSVLRLAHAYEQATRFYERRPALGRP